MAFFRKPRGEASVVQRGHRWQKCEGSDFVSLREEASQAGASPTALRLVSAAAGIRATRSSQREVTVTSLS